MLHFVDYLKQVPNNQDHLCIHSSSSFPSFFGCTSNCGKHIREATGRTMKYISRILFSTPWLCVLQGMHVLCLLLNFKSHVWIYHAKNYISSVWWTPSCTSILPVHVQCFHSIRALLLLLTSWLAVRTDNNNWNRMY